MQGQGQRAQGQGQGQRVQGKNRRRNHNNKGHNRRNLDVASNQRQSKSPAVKSTWEQSKANNFVTPTSGNPDYDNNNYDDSSGNLDYNYEYDNDNFDYGSSGNQGFEQILNSQLSSGIEIKLNR